MVGYKFMESDMTCRGFQYEIGQIYEITESIWLCECGFHFCENPANCFRHYNNIKGDKRLFKVEALGKVISNDNKSVTNKIKILEEITNVEEFLCNKSHHEVDWDYISMYQKLSEDIIEKFKDKVNWIIISMYQKLSEDFIEKFKDKVDWFYISSCQVLSELFIEKFKDKVDWHWISEYQKLSENFIEKYQDNVNWDKILVNQTLSEDFIEKFKDKIQSS